MLFELVANGGNGGRRLQVGAAQLPFDVRGVSSVKLCFPIIRLCVLAPFYFGGVDGSCNFVVLFYQRRAPSLLFANGEPILFPQLHQCPFHFFFLSLQLDNLVVKGQVVKLIIIIGHFAWSTKIAIDPLVCKSL